MHTDIWFGLTLGIFLAVADAVLVQLVIKKGIKDPANAARTMMFGFAGRYALVVAVLGFALLIPSINAVSVVIPLIVQKAVMVVLAVIRK